MFTDRIKNIISKMKAPAYLVTNQADLIYLTGIDLDGFWLLLTKKGVFVFTYPMLGEHLKSMLPAYEVISGPNVTELLIKFCRKNKLGKIGINSGSLNYNTANALNKRLKIQCENDLIIKHRQVKDEREIELIRKSCKIAARAARYVKTLLKPGVSENEISFKIQEFFARNNSKTAFPPIVASGPNSAWPHHTNSTRKIRQNDIVLVDLGCIYKGYCSDLTRTFFLGKISNSNRVIYSLVKQAHFKAVKKVKSGIKSSTIDSIARRIINSGGHGKHFIHSTGHSLGLEIHEAPSISPKDNTILKPGMVITVEPGVYLSKREGESRQFGVRIEDTVLVTKKGCEVLTK